MHLSIIQFSFYLYQSLFNYIFFVVNFLGVLKKTISIFFYVAGEKLISLTSETVQGASLTFQSIDNVHSCDGLSLGVFSVCDGITNDVFRSEEHTSELQSQFHLVC